jgi:hypothetical protein
LRPELRSVFLSDGSEVSFPLNAKIELIGGKLKALLGRVVIRDLYVIYRIAGVYPVVLDSKDRRLLRRILLYYSALSNPFPKPFDIIKRFANRERDVETTLYPMLTSEDRPSLEEMIEVASSFTKNATTPADDAEKEYLKRASCGDFAPELLFTDYPSTLAAARNDPVATWKMQNLRKAPGNFVGLSSTFLLDPGKPNPTGCLWPIGHV